MPKIVNLVFVVVICSAPLFAQHSDWEIRLIGGGRVTDASLLDLKGDSLDVSSPDFDGKLDIEAIADLRRGRSHLLDGAAFGFVAGAVVGYFIGSKAEDNVTTNYYSSSSNGDKRVSSLFMGGAIGGAGGVLIGALSGRDVHSLDGNHEEKLASVRKILRGEKRTLTTEDGEQRDVVVLRNGSIIRGAVVELIPDSTVKILTADSSLFIFRMAEVSRITKENVTRSIAPRVLRESTSQDSPPPATGRSFSFAISGGAGFPIGDFGATSGNNAGAAKTGFTAGADIGYSFNPGLDWLTSVYFCFHSLDVSGVSAVTDLGSWSLVWPMTGLRVISEGPEKRFFALGQVGLLAETTPEVGSQSFSATSIALSFGAGAIFNQRFTVQARYLYGNPEFEINAYVVNSLVSIKVQQPTSVILLVLGMTF